MDCFKIAPERKALVTGGASGIGYATAQRLANAGASVAIADINQGQLQKSAGELGSKVLPVPMDVADRSSVSKAVSSVEAAFGCIDTLVTTAGVFWFRDALNITEEEWDRTIDINLKGTFLACQAVLPSLRASGRGRIVTVSSISGKRGDDFASHYSASKFGVVGLTQSLAVENGRFGTTVNSVCPGTIPGTNMGKSSMNQKINLRKLSEEDIIARDSKNLPLGRLGTVNDIADAILFLITDNASWITGQTLTVDGGALLSGPSHAR